MQRTSITTLLPTLLGALALAAPARGQEYPACDQDHPNGARRAESLFKRGDVYMVRRLSGHTVLYATRRYGLQEHFDDEAIQVAAGKLYDFLKWKLGSPSLVALQWLSDGYQHFDKTYVDEAAAILLGVIEVDVGQPELRLPPFMQDWIMAQVGKTGEAIAAFLVTKGVPAPLAKILGDRVEQALADLYDRNLVGVYIPKSYDVDNRLVEAAVLALQNEGSSDWLRGRGKLAAPASGPGIGFGHRDASPDRLPAPVAARIAELEERVALLEAMLANLMGPGGADGNAVVARGYERVWIEITNWSKHEVRVQVNGLLTGIYHANRTLDLSPFLVKGKVNSIAFECIADDRSMDVEVTIYGTLPGSDEQITMFDFRTAKDRLADGIQLPITGE